MFTLYLNFDGNLKEAFDFYKEIFGGEYKTVNKYSEMPNNDGLSEEDKEKIMHIELFIDENTKIMGSDVLEVWAQEIKRGNNFYINYTPKTEVEARRIFSLLSQGGEVQMPLQKTFWGSLFGTVTDKFGTQWMIDLED